MVVSYAWARDGVAGLSSALDAGCSVQFWHYCEVHEVVNAGFHIPEHFNLESSLNSPHNCLESVQHYLQDQNCTTQHTRVLLPSQCLLGCGTSPKREARVTCCSHPHECRSGLSVALLTQGGGVLPAQSSTCQTAVWSQCWVAHTAMQTVS